MEIMVYWEEWGLLGLGGWEEWQPGRELEAQD